MREPVRSESNKATTPTKIELVTYNSIAPRSLRPKQRFQGVEVSMREGYVKTIDIPLWTENPRTDIELAQFRKEYGRDPNPEERLELIWGNDKDEFKIEELARSIALNGVRVPPIIDVDGTLLDGNRRIAACQYILHNKSKNFNDNDEAFKNAEYIWIWQLTEDATEDDKQRVIAARNFEPDYKQDWTKYTKAKELYKAWQEMSSRSRGKIDNTQKRKDLAYKFAIKPNQVQKYIKTMEFVEIFKEYHIEEKSRDTYDVEDVVDRYYAYLEKIASSRLKIVEELENNEEVKHLIFDLLFEGKFTKDEQFNVSEFKMLINNLDALDELKKAQKETDKKEAQKIIEKEIYRLKSNQPKTIPKLENEIKECIELLDSLNRNRCEKITLETLKTLSQTLQFTQSMLTEFFKQKDEV